MAIKDKLRFHLIRIIQNVELNPPSVSLFASAVGWDYLEEIKKGTEEIVSRIPPTGPSQNYISADDIVSRIVRPTLEALQLNRLHPLSPWTQSHLIGVVYHLEQMQSSVPGLDEWVERCKSILPRYEG